MAIDEYLACYKGQVCCLDFEWVASSHLALTNFHLDDPSELSHGFAVNDSTINIVLVVLLL